MRLSNLWVARVLGAQNSQAPRSSRTSATNPAAHTILNNKCEDEWKKISGWGLTILFSQFCACKGGRYTISEFEFSARVRGHQQLPFLNFVPAYGLQKSFEKTKENKLFGTRLKYKYIARHRGISKRKGLGAVFTEPQVCLDSTSRQPKWILPLPHGSQKKKLVPNL